MKSINFKGIYIHVDNRGFITRRALIETNIVMQPDHPAYDEASFAELAEEVRPLAAKYDGVDIVEHKA